jgi:hypothetical protein
MRQRRGGEQPSFTGWGSARHGTNFIGGVGVFARAIGLAITGAHVGIAEPVSKTCHRRLKSSA